VSNKQLIKTCAMTKKRVVVLFGGRSAEREISLITGKQIIANLNRARYAVTPIEIPRTGNAWLNKLMRAKPDVVIPALHGPFGEDGTVQGMLEMLNIPYTFSGVLASALAMDKYRLIEFLRVHGVLAPRGVLLTNDEPSPIRAKRRMKKAHINFPCVVKPNRLGSSVGVTVNIKNMRDLGKALRLAFHCDSEVLVEEHIRGREITAPVLGNENPRALPLIEITPKIGAFYNYRSKYAPGGSSHALPAPLSPAMTKRIQDIAMRAHKLVGARGVSRSDFILRDNQPYFLELNTIPGMTKTSLVPESAQKAGIPFQKLLNMLIAFAMK